MEKRKKKLPIGIEDFEKIRTEDFYYIDKTGMICSLLRSWGQVNLFTRPRRFGKSLNMSMLKSFFEIGGRKDIFDGLEISEETELCRKYMGKFPVISISLKSVNGTDYETARTMLCSVIGREAMRFQFLLESEKLTVTEKEQYSQLISTGGPGGTAYEMADDVLMGSLYLLTDLLEKHYGIKVILLIDEYDVPLSKASENGYYDRMVMLIRNMFDLALKTNVNLYFAVLTGCLRVAKESIFTGLNNFNVLSILDVGFHESFGFTDSEVKLLLRDYGLTDAYDLIKEWYDGYRFGNENVYCPWDVICYCGRLQADPSARPEAFWSNTSSNTVVRHFLENARSVTKQEIERLIAGESIVKKIRPELTYKDMYDSIDNIWSVLFTTGYLTYTERLEENVLRLTIPNRETRSIFEDQITDWFQEAARRDGTTLNAFCEAFLNGDEEQVQKMFGDYLRRTISIRDTAARNDLKENYYHGLLLGLLGYKENWHVVSNRESGDGYSDILAEIDEKKTGIVIEVKYAADGDLDAACRTALRQIGEKNYCDLLYDDGMKTVLKYGAACYKKRCRIMMERETSV